MSDLAVVIDSVGFGYTKNHPVLKDVSIHVPRGAVYCLLGSNGCGKTTLLNILLGRIQPQQGSIQVLGTKVEANNGHQLNHLIGYMPQHIALIPGMDIEETFFYFARVNHVRDRGFVLKRIQSYLHMLGLTNAKQFVWQLSGGQKRLLSLGVTLIYEPAVLLLDEPTVGVDSLIRRDIWKHLKEICYQKNVTVIITTHYIDEAKQSNMVGFIKDGGILAEQSPNSLMHQLECNTLEEVFYKLCLKDNANKKLIKSSSASGEQFRYSKVDPDKMTDDHHNHQNGYKHNAPQIAYNKQHYCSKGLFNVEHLQALACREWTIFKSNLQIFALMILIPLFTITLFQSSYGRTPRNVPVAIVNRDEGINQTGIGRISEIYLQEFNTSMVKLNFFPTESAAFKSLKEGKNVIALAFRPNFSRAFVNRYSIDGMLSFESLYDERNVQQLIHDSNIHQYIDLSDTLNARYLNRSVLQAFHRMVQQFGAQNGLNPYIFSTPIQVERLVYGSLEPHLQDLFQAGIIIIILVAITVLMTALRIVSWHADGCLERDLNQGVKPIELLLTFQMAPLIPVLIQILVVLLFSFYVIGIKLDGSFWEAYLIVFLTTYQGIFFGAFIGIFCRTQLSALIFSFTLMVVIFFSGGILWPVEGMPSTIQKIFLINPIMLPIRSLRCIMLRGWSMQTSFMVTIGYITSGATCAVLFVLESVLFHWSVKTIN